MKKKLLIFGILLLIVGAVLFFVGLVKIDFNFSKLNAGGPYVQKTFTSEQTVLSVFIKDKNADVTFIKTEGANFTVTFDENEKEKYTITETDGVLTVESKYDYKWYDYLFNFTFHDKEVIVEVPSYYNGNVNVRTLNGSINLKDLEFDDMTLYTENGPISLNNISCKNINCETSNGTIKLENIKATGIELETSNGRIYFNKSTCTSLSAKSTNGRICISESVIEGTTYAKTSNGGIILEKADFKSDASCLTSNGTISGSIMGSEEDFYYKCSTSNGDCNLPNDFGVGAKTLTLKTSNGDIKISFIKKAE